MKQRTALITGATRGLGAEIARQFWQSGANLILTARSHEKLKHIAQELQSASQMQDQTLQIIETDLSEPASVNSLIERIQHASIDILVNNAAIQGPIGSTWENDWSLWQSTLQVDLLAPIALCRAVVPQMIQKNYGKIINLSGGGATAARPKFSAYAVAKAGLVRFSETLAEEVKDYRITVNCIAPGVMSTDMLAEIINAGEIAAGQKEVSHAKTKGSKEVIAKAAELCVFLASAQSDGISGKLISAVWDPWKTLPGYLDDLTNSDIYTLRRIIPKDRGKAWGEVV